MLPVTPANRLMVYTKEMVKAIWECAASQWTSKPRDFTRLPLSLSCISISQQHTFLHLHNMIQGEDAKQSIAGLAACIATYATAF